MRLPTMKPKVPDVLASAASFTFPTLESVSPDYAAARAKMSELETKLGAIKNRIIEVRNAPAVEEVATEKKGRIRALLGAFADAPSGQDDIRVRVTREETTALLESLEQEREELEEAVRAMVTRLQQLKVWAERIVVEQVRPMWDAMLAEYARTSLARWAAGNEMRLLLSAAFERDIVIGNYLPQFEFTSDLRPGWHAARPELKTLVRALLKEKLLDDNDIPPDFFAEGTPIRPPTQLPPGQYPSTPFDLPMLR